MEPELVQILENIEILEIRTNDVSYSKLPVEGPAPFKESGVYEVQISIVGDKPEEGQIKNKTFTPLWKGTFHARSPGSPSTN